MLNEDSKRDVQKRLKKISGQIQGIQKMIEEDRYCVDTLIQLSAARAALGKVSNEILQNHLETCVRHSFHSEDPAKADQKIEELIDVFSRYMTR